MPDAQILATLRRVREARKAASAQLQQPGLSADATVLCRKVYDALDAMEEQLVDAQLASNVEKLGGDALALDLVVDDMKKSDAQLQQLAAVVGSVAKAVGVLASVIGQLVAHGLI